MLFVCHPKLCIRIVFSFSWGHFNSQEKQKTMLMQNFGVTNKEHYSMLWYFQEWSIVLIFYTCILVQMQQGQHKNSKAEAYDARQEAKQNIFNLLMIHEGQYGNQVQNAKLSFEFLQKLRLQTQYQSLSRMFHPVYRHFLKNLDYTSLFSV